MDFVYAAYEKLLDAFVEAGYRSACVCEALQDAVHPPLLILRHDVEWDARKALALADMELARGLRSTFYFRVDTAAYDPAAMRFLQDEGLEVGYHFNTLDRCAGDLARAIALFEADLQRLRGAGIDVVTAKAHGDPRARKIGYEANDDVLDRDPDLLQRNGLLDYRSGLKTRYPDHQYLSDLGIRWNPQAATREVISRIETRDWPVIYMAIHPDYWSRSTVRAMGLQVAARTLRCFRLNSAIRAAKGGLAALRGASGDS